MNSFLNRPDWEINKILTKSQDTEDYGYRNHFHKEQPIFCRLAQIGQRFDREANQRQHNQGLNRKIESPARPCVSVFDDLFKCHGCESISARQPLLPESSGTDLRIGFPLVPMLRMGTS